MDNDGTDKKMPSAAGQGVRAEESAPPASSAASAASIQAIDMTSGQARAADAPASSSDAPAPDGAASDATASNEAVLSADVEALTDDIVAALKSVYDPEIPVDIYELGLIYRVEITDDRDVLIDMTLTAPGCPVAEHMPVWVHDAVSAVDGIGDVKVNMTFDPPWDPGRMSDEARVALNMF